MKIRISELRSIIREELERAAESGELEEGLGKWLTGAALAGGLALGAMKGGGPAAAGKSQDSMSAPAAPQKKDIEAKVDGMDTAKMKDIIGKLKNSDAAKGDARFNLALKNLEKEKDAPTMKLGLKTFAIDPDFAYRGVVASTILAQ